MESDLNAYILMEYTLSNLTTTNKQFLWEEVDSVVPAMVEILENGYFERSSGQLEYNEFAITIDSINNVDVSSLSASRELYNALDVSNVWDTPITLGATIDIEKTSASLVTSNTDHEFSSWTNGEFEAYFNNSGLSFGVESSADEMAVIDKFTDSDTTESDNTAVMTGIVILAAGVFVSGCAFLWDKMPLTRSDESTWQAPFLLSIHLYDFVSDCLLTYIIAEVAYDEGISIYSIHFWLAAASVATIILPMLLNTAYAAKIQQQESVRGNPAARVWFVICTRCFSRSAIMLLKQ